MATSPKSRGPSLKHEVRMSLGERCHNKEWPSMLAASEALGIHQSTLYACMADWRKTQGIVTDRSRVVSTGMLAANAKKRAPNGSVSAEDKKAKDRERSAARRAAKKEEAARADGMIEVLRAANAHRETGEANGHANGHGRHLVRVNDDTAELIKLRAQVVEVTAERDWALGQLDIVNKLLMTVGSTL